MSDLISRQAAIDALNGEFTITGRENAETIQAYINGVNKKLRELPSAERRGRWIPVTERLPEKYGRYLVTLEDEGYRSVMPLYYGRIGRISTFYDSDSEWGDVAYDDVIAWMELPEPFNKEVEE